MLGLEEGMLGLEEGTLGLEEETLGQEEGMLCKDQEMLGQGGRHHGLRDLTQGHKKKGRLRLSSQSSFSCRDYWTRTSDLAPPRRVRYQLR